MNQRRSIITMLSLSSLLLLPPDLDAETDKRKVMKAINPDGQVTFSGDEKALVSAVSVNDADRPQKPRESTSMG